MKINLITRADQGKTASRRLRREGVIPAVLYSRGQAGESIAIEREAFASHLRQVQKGHLSTTVFTLVDPSGKERKALVKEIQYHPTSYEVIHLDFEELLKEHPINVKVPIECIGVAECVGVKQGGVLRQVIRHLRVRCLPKDIPVDFKLDVSKLEMRQSLRLRDISLPETLRPLADLNEVAVGIVKR